MKRFHQIAACLFAILIANPVVCCGAHLASGDSSGCHQSAQKGCCQTDEGGPASPVAPSDHPCGCHAQAPREIESTPAWFVAPSFDRLPPQLPHAILPALRPESTGDSAWDAVSRIPRPPGLCLALLQRYRI